MIDLLKRTIVPLVAALSLLAGLIFLPWGWPLGLLILVTLAIIGLGVHDWCQKRWTIARNYPVAGWIRWLFYDLRPYLRAYIVEDDLEGTPYNYEARSLIHARARGKTDTHPFGTERDTASQEYRWIQHSIAPHPDPDRSARERRQRSNPSALRGFRAEYLGNEFRRLVRRCH